MSKMSRARGLPEITRRWTRPRKYPWVYDVAKTAAFRMECEGCRRYATHRVLYLERENQADLMTVYLCNEHVLYTRILDRWKELFKIIDKKIAKGEK